MNFLTTILAFCVTLGILIIIHEYGHYWVARRFGVKVLRFSIGFGKPIFLWKNKKDPDGTEWSVAAIPLGGYVRMLDERDEKCLPIAPEDKNKTFNSKKPWQRLLIVLAGPVSNLVLASVIYAGLFMYGTQEAEPIIAKPAAETLAAEAGFEEGDKILSVNGNAIKTFSDFRLDLIKNVGDEVQIKALTPQGIERTFTVSLKGVSIDEDKNNPNPIGAMGFNLMVSNPIISGFVENSAAKAAGMAVGDEVLAVNGHPVKTPAEFVDYVKKSPGQPLQIEIQNPQGEKQSLTVTPSVVKDAEGQDVGRVGATISVKVPLINISYGPFESLWKGAEKTWDTAWFSLEMVGKMFTGEVSVKNISGPVTIADYAGQTARLGLVAFCSFLALVSISLGVLNLLPIPMLDGGHVLYYLVEIFTGKPVSEQFQMLASKFGIAALIGLTVLALFNDLSRLLP